MKLLRYIRRLFWAYIPHHCRFAYRSISPTRTHASLVCVRCGTAIWFNVPSGQHKLNQ